FHVARFAKSLQERVQIGAIGVRRRGLEHADAIDLAGLGARCERYRERANQPGDSCHYSASTVSDISPMRSMRPFSLSPELRHARGRAGGDEVAGPQRQDAREEPDV